MPPRKGKAPRTAENANAITPEQADDDRQETANKRRISGTAEEDDAKAPIRTKQDATPQTPKTFVPFTGTQLDLSSPPLSDIHEIFSHITNKALDKGPQGNYSTLDDMTNHLGNLPMRVATMCSGSESPILALKLVQQCLKQAGKAVFELEHVFSAENEPFKQAYIQRNFSPPLLFRDILEMVILEDKKTMTGSTAYGAPHDVPRDIDILAVGSSCVDFSPLNTNQQKDLPDRKGKSRETFDAVCRYVEWAKPRIVIFENVKSNIKKWAMPPQW